MKKTLKGGAGKRSAASPHDDPSARHEEYFQRRPWERPPRRLVEHELSTIVDNIDKPYYFEKRVVGKAYQFKKAMDMIAASATGKIEYYSSPDSRWRSAPCPARPRPRFGGTLIMLSRD